MRKDKHKAISLRLKGKSYSEIQTLLSIPKSTLSGWLSQITLPSKSKRRLAQKAYKKSIKALLKRNKNQTTLAIARAQDNQKNASREIKQLSKDNLLILGVALYWAEGYKRAVVRNGKEVTSHPVSLTNSDPYLIKAFLRFIKEYCLVPNEKIKANLRIFPHQNEKKVLDYWQNLTDLPLTNFGKTYRGVSISSRGKKPYNRLKNGIIQIVVANTPLFHKIMGYIEGIKKMI
ncbi:MAG: hypothetical protein A2826_01950 [Candidatus Doudnabacteria bacterium RIFCSPHIGHO2_01_FULL_43_23]|uniref:Uncharacterized protein n=1 Tax=Candidatus Doudnabacteria bacterium RIFCSPHIGHO2_01_FULL_43_23 TaxID=1817822 RepID=A0A1F5NS99_9BACT|nr:MAG: hypothetical protein A2826_01950 [Candidatus Doudnabacteria bacterium RIFCSPHIGHO2_01_FULL_43_23]